jgi:hypothetical protein
MQRLVYRIKLTFIHSTYYLENISQENHADDKYNISPDELDKITLILSIKVDLLN